MQICEKGDGAHNSEQESATELRAKATHGDDEPVELAPLIAKRQER